jgi:hypothetical protein
VNLIGKHVAIRLQGTVRRQAIDRGSRLLLKRAPGQYLQERSGNERLVVACLSWV